MHCSQCKNGNSSPFFFFLRKAGSVGWLIGIGIVSSTVSSDLFLFSVFVPLLLLVVVLFHLLCAASISCRRRCQTRCAVHLSAIAIFSVATTARRVGGKYQNTAQPEVYMSLNRSLANRLLTAESTYFEKERVACLFCIMVVVSSATGK